MKVSRTVGGSTRVGGSTFTGGLAVTGGAGGSQAARITAAPRAQAAAAATVNTFRRLSGLGLSFPDGGGGGVRLITHGISPSWCSFELSGLIVSRFMVNIKLVSGRMGIDTRPLPGGQHRQNPFGQARSLSGLGLGGWSQASLAARPCVRADFCPFYLLRRWQNTHLAHAKLRFCRLASGTEDETRNLRHQKSSGKPQTRQTPRRMILPSDRCRLGIHCSRTFFSHNLLTLFTGIKLI